MRILKRILAIITSKASKNNPASWEVFDNLVDMNDLVSPESISSYYFSEQILGNPEVLGSFTKLSGLRIATTKGRIINLKEVGKVAPHLETLEIIGSGAGFYIGESFGSLKDTIKHLRIQNCKLSMKSLKKILNFENLQILDLSGTSLIDPHLSKVISRRKRIKIGKSRKTLRLLRISKDRALMEKLDKFTRLEELNLSCCSIRSLPDNWKMMQSVIHLDISKNTLQIEAFEKLPKIFPNLQYLKISESKIDSDRAKCIASIATLTHLDVSECRLTDEGLEHISKMDNLVYLNASSSKITRKGIERISEMKTLTLLNLSDNKLGEKDSEDVSRMGNLTHLDLSNNMLGDEGARRISEMKNLKHLNLSENWISDMGVKFISEMNKLECLNLSQNFVCVKGVEYISGIECLKSLDISQNPIGNFGAEHISKMKNLKYLRMFEIPAEIERIVSGMENLIELGISVGNNTLLLVERLLKIKTLQKLLINGLSEQKQWEIKTRVRELRSEFEVVFE